jgi:hypothetical protein
MFGKNRIQKSVQIKSDIFEFSAIKTMSKIHKALAYCNAKNQRPRILEFTPI